MCIEMKSSVYIPQGLWHFVGCELVSSGYMNEDSFYSVKEEPLIRWLLFDDAEWREEYSQVGLFNFDGSVVRKEKEDEVYYLNLFVRETFRRTDILNKYPNTHEMIILRGYIGFDNVILMNKQKIEFEFKELEEKYQLLDNSVEISVDYVQLGFFIEALIEIYRFRITEFKKEVDEDFLAVTALHFLLSLKIKPRDFQLKCLTKSDEGWRLEERIRENILKAFNQKTPTTVLDRSNNVLVEFDVGSLFSLEDGRIRVDFGSFGLKTKGNLVGLGHIMYSPKIFGAYTVGNVMDSWNWLVKETKVNEKDLQMAFESSSLAMLLLTGIEFGKDVLIFSLIFDLFNLDSAGVDTSQKIEEFGQQIRRHIRKFEKLIEINPWKAIIKADSLKNYLSNVSSECRLARLAKSYGCEIEFGKHPDLKINGKGVEIKKLSAYSLSNPIDEGMRQPHDIIAIEVASLEKREIPNRKATWLGTSNLREAMQTALNCGNEGNTVLLFMATAKGVKGRMILLKR